MKYYKMINLKNGKKCLLRHGVESDGAKALENFNLTHEQTDFLLSYPNENQLDPEKESSYLKEKAESENEIEILAIVDEEVVGMAGIEQIGSQCKVRHRAEFGISIAEEYWGLGIGRALTEACVECAREAGYLQLELEVVADNDRAVAMYQRAGFTEYGRNPMGFRSRTGNFQETISMRMPLFIP